MPGYRGLIPILSGLSLSERLGKKGCYARASIIYYSTNSPGFLILSHGQYKIEQMENQAGARLGEMGNGVKDSYTIESLL